MLSPHRSNQLMGWLLSVCALIGLNLSEPGTFDLPSMLCGTPVLPSEEDESAPVSEGAVVIEAAQSRREPGQPRCERPSVIRPHSHTPSTGFETSDFRPPPDHFRNGLGTPFRC